MRSRAERLSDIAADYDVLFCDVWGVLHGGRTAYPAAVEALRRFRAAGKRVVMVSNSPRPGRPLAGQLRDIYATPPDAFDAVVSAGDVMVDALAARPGAWHLEGPASDLAIFEGLAVRFTAADEAQGVVMTQLKDGSRESAETYRPMLDTLRARAGVFVCGNADRVVEHGGRRYVCPGAVADLYEAMGGEVVWCGKPYRPIYDIAFAAIPDVARTRVLAIGDGIATDVRGAAAVGIDVMFITGGIHAEDVASGAGERLLAPFANVVALAGRLAW